MNPVYIVDAVRTPIGRYSGGLASVRPDDLAAHAIRELLSGIPQLDPARIEDVYLGNANGAGEENRNVAHMAALLAGLPTSVPGATVNRLCASGLEAVIQAARAIAVGDASVAIAGGVESMTRAPYVLPKNDRPFPAAHAELYSTTLGWRMVNPAMNPQWTIPLGESAELIAEKHKIGRDQQDEFALHSHQKAAAAQVLGCLAEWPEFDQAILNPQGGAIALGHPLGASGARLVGTVAHQLARRGSGTGVATLCIGVGQGLALVLER
ncbi:beta-ketoacyl synthase N-terminal-like domain-containing protein [Streptomyces mirabilis]|uniref:thiolase family protein n=1 Tax=Streptomyces mirabilis TaxID=68239 RepID=UPI0036992D88